MGILDAFLGVKSKASLDADPNFSENLHTLESALEKFEPEHASFLAAFALLMGRVAFADLDISEKEIARMKGILQNDLDTEFQLDAEQAELVTNLAVDKTLQINTEDHIVVKRLKSKDQKTRYSILRCLFHLAAADDISEDESNEIKSIAKSLGISDKEFFNLRSEFREYLSILKKTKSGDRK
jgi:uncharacterized tellurite resistance protein B-like protein